MEFGLLIKNLLVIGAIIGVTIASQVPFFATVTKNYVYSPGIKGENQYVKNAGNWIQDHITSRLPGQGGGAALTESPATAVAEEIKNQKNNLVENSVQGTKKFIAEKILNMLGVAPDELAGCKAD